MNGIQLAIRGGRGTPWWDSSGEISCLMRRRASRKTSSTGSRIMDVMSENILMDVGKYIRRLRGKECFSRVPSEEAPEVHALLLAWLNTTLYNMHSRSCGRSPYLRRLPRQVLRRRWNTSCEVPIDSSESTSYADIMTHLTILINSLVIPMRPTSTIRIELPD